MSAPKPRGRPKKQPVPQEEVHVVEETPEKIQDLKDSQETKAPLSPASPAPTKSDLAPSTSDVVPVVPGPVPEEEKLTHLLQEWYELSKGNFREELDTTRLYLWCAYRVGIVNILNLTAREGIS